MPSARRARYTVVPSAMVMVGLQALRPDEGWDRVLKSSFPRPRGR
jgi:hypothetical protein